MEIKVIGFGMVTGKKMATQIKHSLAMAPLRVLREVEVSFDYLLLANRKIVASAINDNELPFLKYLTKFIENNLLKAKSTKTTCFSWELPQRRFRKLGKKISRKGEMARKKTFARVLLNVFEVV